MNVRKKYIRKKIRAMYIATASATATRDTKLNDMQSLYNLNEANLSLIWPGCHADAIL